MDLDATDRKILGILRVNGRIPNNELAASVGLSASACLRRVKLLEQNGVIKGYRAIVATSDAPGSLTAIVRITLDKQTEDYLNRFEAAIRRHPEIVECFLMTGNEDYILRVVAPNNAAYETIHKEILSRLPGVARIHSSFAIRSIMAS